MKTAHLTAILCGMALLTSMVSPMAHAQTSATPDVVKTRVGTLDSISGYPTADTAQKLYDELDFQREVQAYLWALPMASYGAMADEHHKLGADDHAVIVADNSAEPRQLVLTANQDTIYMSGVLDLSKGPMVIDVPPGLLGTMNNIWQQPLVDIGGPFSPEQNRGGRFLVLPPAYNGPMPAISYHVVQSDTNIAIYYLRALPRTLADYPKLRELARTFRQYRLAEAANPPKMKFISMTGLNANFLTEAAKVGRAMAEVVSWYPRVPEADLHPYADSPWKWLFISDDPSFHTADYLVIDQRSRYGFEAIGTSKSMVVAAAGQGSQYICVYQDSKGHWLTGDNTFKIHLPKDIPAANFWSLAVYDNHSRSLIQNDQSVASLGSIRGAVENPDGSVDAYFGPVRPEGVPEENWIQTKPGMGYFIYLRLYGPLESFFDKSWRPGDPEIVK